MPGLKFPLHSSICERHSNLLKLLARCFIHSRPPSLMWCRNGTCNPGCKRRSEPEAALPLPTADAPRRKYPPIAIAIKYLLLQIQLVRELLAWLDSSLQLLQQRSAADRPAAAPRAHQGSNLKAAGNQRRATYKAHPNGHTARTTTIPARAAWTARAGMRPPVPATVYRTRLSGKVLCTSTIFTL
eukprot:SAG31_NODE_6356_length_2045_cov_10.681437_2_plen_185_part_00